MIVSIRDAENNLVDGAAITSILAGLTAVGKSKKTLVLQFTENYEDNIINVLIGRDIKQNMIRDQFSYVDDGLDALFLRAETSDLTKEHYDECVTALLDKSNLFDVLKPTNKARFTEIVSQEVIENVLKNAEDVYDYIYVFLPSNDKELLDIVTPLTKEDLIIIPQGRKKEVDLSNGKTHLVVKDFENTSKFDQTSIKKRYGVKKIYVVPHNVGFRDNIINQTLLDFILVNKKGIKEDSNYSLTSSLYSLISKYVTDKEDDDEEIELKPKEPSFFMLDEDLSLLAEDSVQEVTVKKGLLGRKRQKIMINM